MVAYIGGICLLSLGITFSINANLGVSPVSSLGYAFALISPLSIGIATFASNILFIFIQFFLTQKFEFKSYILQLSMSFVMGLILNAIGGLAQILPDANVLWIQAFFLFLLSHFCMLFKKTIRHFFCKVERSCSVCTIPAFHQ